MSVTDEVLKNNENYARSFTAGNLPMPPAKKLFVLACMDARLQVGKILGLKEGDAHVFRNAGGVATMDAIRSLVISQRLLGTEEVILIHHTDCGMLTFKDEALRKQLETKTGASPVAPAHFHAFDDLAENVRAQVERIKSHPWVPQNIPVRGFVYDVKTGRLHEVVEEAPRKVG